MRIWIVTVGEPLPSDGIGSRLWRSGALAKRLAAAGHDVTWWTSSFDHMRKVQRAARSEPLAVPGFPVAVRLLYGPSYLRNLSLRRIVNHELVAREFRRLAPSEPTPDLILCSFPTHELAREAVRYGRARNVPVFLDIRDLWPDAYAMAVPARVQPPVRAAVRLYARTISEPLRRATGLIGISEGYLQWGLHLARRPRGELDAVFPLGHVLPQASSADIADARAALEQMGVDQRKHICWFLGSMGRTYDVPTIIRAAERLWVSGRRDIQFVISGVGENLDTWRNMAKSVPSVVFTGFVAQPGLVHLSRSADIGLAAYAPGAPQGLPNKLFDYLGAGLAVASSLSGEAVDFLEREKCGISYRAGDSVALADAVEALLEAPEQLAAMQQRGMEIHERQFSADAVYPAMVDFLVAAANK